MTMQQPKSTTRFSTPIVSELAEQSTKAKPVIKPKKKKKKNQKMAKFKTKSNESSET